MSKRSPSDVDFDALLRAGFTGAVGLPLVVAAVFVALPEPSAIPWWRSFDAGLWARFVGLFGLVGVILGVAWTLECRIAFALGLVALVGAVAWPPLGFGELPNVVSTLVGTAVVGLPTLVLAVPLEYAARRSDRRLRPTRVEAVALVVGLVHLLVVNWLTATLENRLFLPRPSELAHADPAGLVALTVIAGGLILLGAVPVVLAWRLRLVTPAGFVLVAFGWATYRTWQLSLETLPPAGPGFGLVPTPLTLYLWGGSLLLVGAVLIGGLEYLFHRKRGAGSLPPLEN
ncbi:hypothetical protein [Natronobacterium texcoconense]|uniref:Uncharacterized protein n=1 Tax=Natronobacterium texcoconense TaxID=1095778 RepID=A0A1H1J2R7_NATTX|nr:hypothetical protein [Natronobacterium texcoconense]SDR43778.1 hypothetical protein SAMN04489842_4006 [Natronobacterium texcoconense]